MSYIVGITAVVGANYLITDGVVKGGLADIRVETATLATKVDERLGFVREDYAKSVAEIRGVVESGLEDRTDEVMRALIASQDLASDWVIRVANVPRDSDAADRMSKIVADFKGGATTYALAGKLNYELRVKSLTSEQAMLVQEAWDAAADPSIGVKIFPASDLLEAIKGKPDD